MPTDDDHVEDPTDAHAASAITVTPVGDLTATDAQTALADLDARLRALLQLSPDALHDAAVSYEEFFGTGKASGLIGSLGWTLVTADTGAISEGTSAHDAPGYYALTTGTGAAGAAAIHLGTNQLHNLLTRAFIWECRVQSALNPATHGATFRCGLHDNGVGGEPTDGAYFEILSTTAAATWRCRTAKAGVRNTPIDSGQTAPTGVWRTLRISGDGGGNVYFSVDGLQVGVESTASTIPVATTEAFGRVFSLTKSAGSGTPRQFRIDYEYLLWSVAR